MNSEVMTSPMPGYHTVKTVEPPSNVFEKEAFKKAETTASGESPKKKTGRWWSFFVIGGKRRREMESLHGEMMGAMRDMCEILEKSGERSAEVFEEKVIKPFPVNALNQMAAQQERLTGTLTSLDAQMDRAEERDGEVMNALVSVKESNQEASTAMGIMATSVDENSDRYGELFVRMRESEEKVMLKMQKLQRRSNLYSLGFGILLTTIAIAVGVSVYMIRKGSIIVESGAGL